MRMSREEGVGALWNGTGLIFEKFSFFFLLKIIFLGPSLILVSNPTIHFVVYERLKEFMVSNLIFPFL